MYVLNQRQLTKEEEYYYVNLYQTTRDKEAFDILVISQVAWAMKLSVHFCEVKQWNNIDAAQSASFLGIMRAIEKFELSRGNRLTTYTRFWVNHFLRREHQQEREIVHVPLYLSDKIQKKNKYQKDAEVARKRVKPLPFDWEEKTKYIKPHTVLDTMVEDEHKMFVVQEVTEAINLLPVRYATVIINRFWKKQTYKQIAEEFNVTKQRVQQMVIIAKEQLVDILGPKERYFMMEK